MLMKVPPPQLTRKSDVFEQIAPPHSTAMFFVAPPYQELTCRFNDISSTRLMFLPTLDKAMDNFDCEAK